MRLTQLTANTGAMEQLETTATNFFDAIMPYVWIAVAAALIVNGILMVVGGEEGRQKAKKAFPWVLIGCVVVLGAVSISNWVIGNIAFGS